MEKKVWVRPEMNTVTFMANEYIASTCGDTKTVYLFKCDSENDNSFFDDVGGMVYQETTGNDKLDWIGSNQDTYLGDYHACGATHEASTTDAFLDGWYKPYNNLLTAIKVKIWRGPNGDNIHCTTKIDMNTWETAKS